MVAQRLLRTVCPDCKSTYVAPPGSLDRYGVEEGARLVHGRGCETCYDSGYKGRVPIHELLTCDSATQRLMVESPSRDQFNEHMLAQGVTTLREAGIQRALEGRTTLEEAARVVNA